MRDTAKQLGYISNSSASSLRSGKTYTIAVIVPDISNPQIAHQIKLIEDGFQLIGYTIIILNSDENAESEYQAIITACSKQVDGILLCPTQHNKKSIEFLNKIEMPYVLIGRYFSDIDTSYVCADDYKGGYLVGKYLLENGYLNPVYVGAYSYIQSSKLRHEGLVQALKEDGHSLAFYVEVSPKSQDVTEVIDQIIEKSGNPCSIVAFSDLLAFKIISELKSRKIHCPVIGFDAINSHLHLPVKYVSIGMKGNGWATKAIEILVDQLNNNKTISHNLIDVELLEYNM